MAVVSEDLGGIIRVAFNHIKGADTVADMVAHTVGIIMVTIIVVDGVETTGTRKCLYTSCHDPNIS